MLRYTIEIIGWLAAAMMLSAYLLLTMGKLSARSNMYHWFNALSGAARAAKLSGDNAKAKIYYAKLLAVCEHADGDRPELKEARTLLRGSAVAVQ